MTCARTDRCDARDGGFTLFELLIAIAVFSFVSIMAFSGFWSVQGTQERVAEKAEALAKLQMAFTFVGRDLRQSVPRGVRDDFGDAQPAMIGAAGGYGTLLEFTRAGLRNPTGRPRSHLQRISYGIVDDKFVRLSWPMLDRVQGAQPTEMILLEKVKKIEFRFLDSANQWQTQWPPLVRGEEKVPDLPKALELKIDVEGWGELIRLFATAGEMVI